MMYVRKPVVAGQFYTDNPKELSRQIQSFLKNGKMYTTENEIRGVVSPHAGYIYSGPIAGSAFSSIQNSSYDVVVVIAPSHRYSIDKASVIPDGEYLTPLGKSLIDSSIGNKLLETNNYIFAPEVHEMEHSLEVQVPFIQTVFPDIKISPIVVATTKYDSCVSIGKSLAHVLRELQKNALIVISTDLSHYKQYATAVSIDKKLCDSLETCDTKVLQKSVEGGESSACGYGPLIAGITAAKELGAHECKVIDYRNSGDTAGPKNQVVGYCAAVIS
jgi:AmmeMemoRadiSam system protein B